jgi:hypothetical protein
LARGWLFDSLFYIEHKGIKIQSFLKREYPLVVNLINFALFSEKGKLKVA